MVNLPPPTHPPPHPPTPNPNPQPPTPNPTPDKVAATLAHDIFKCILLNGNDTILIQISLKLLSWSPIDNNPALVLIMAWRWVGDKPLSEPILARFTDTYMRH